MPLVSRITRLSTRQKRTTAPPFEPSSPLPQPHDGEHQQETSSPPECKPTTLTWFVIGTEISRWESSSVGYGLTIRGTYEGYIPTLGANVGEILRSPDDKFTVKHGNITQSRALTLTWGDQQFKFKKNNEAKTNITAKNEIAREYHYWVCIVA
ncbi:hypothetical protein BG015_000240 [Linnemannia schmuckeri]|uniref:Uncharacterized protein n=1 Tax=Linnemannia schmuckeri TaxID=64567 RepID=A0A9P5V7K0_9FUNG|nr:hypothetical protein BG015_000240 [Linnemannia schmuckeri]